MAPPPAVICTTLGIAHSSLCRYLAAPSPSPAERRATARSPAGAGVKTCGKAPPKSRRVVDRGEGSSATYPRRKRGVSDARLKAPSRTMRRLAAACGAGVPSSPRVDPGCSELWGWGRIQGEERGAHSCGSGVCSGACCEKDADCDPAAFCRKSAGGCDFCERPCSAGCGKSTCTPTEGCQL
jgi:hypothetical protein